MVFEVGSGCRGGLCSACYVLGQGKYILDRGTNKCIGYGTGGKLTARRTAHKEVGVRCEAGMLHVLRWGAT